MTKKHLRQLGALVLTLTVMSGCTQADQVGDQNTTPSQTQVEEEIVVEKEFVVVSKDYKYESEKIKIDVKLPLVKLGDDTAIDASRVLQKPILDAMNNALTNADFWQVKDEAFEQKTFQGDFEVVYEDMEIISIQPRIEDESYLLPVTIVKNTGQGLDYSSLPQTESFWTKLNDLSADVLPQRVERDIRAQVFSHYYITESDLVFIIPEWYRGEGGEKTLSVKLSDLRLTRQDFISNEKIDFEVGSKQHIVSKPYYTFAGEIPVFSSQTRPELAQELTDLMEKQIVMNEKLIEDDAKHLYEANKEDGFVYPPDIHTVQFDVKRKDSKYMSLYLSYYAYTGGAHGTHYDLAYNFDMASGQRMALKDMFKEDVDYVSLLNGEVQGQIDKIQKDFVEKNGEGWVPYMGFETIAEDQHFYLTKDSLVIFFGLYEIAPYAAGIPTFEIPFTNIEASLK